MLVFDYIVQTYEQGNPIAVVTHVFTGTSIKKAKGYYRAHLRSDAFLRGCQSGHFGDKAFRCLNHIVGIREREV